MVDCPGSGEALRFLGLKSRVETEDWAKALRRLPRDARRRRPATGSASWAGRWAATTRRAPPRSRSGSRSWSPGAPTTTGARCRSAARARGREPGPALLGARALGVGLRRRRDVHQVRRGRAPQRRRRADHRAVPDHPRRERPADPRRVRPPVLRPGRQQPEARAADLHRPRRAPPSTSASTTCRTSARSPPTGSRTASPSWHEPRRPRLFAEAGATVVGCDIRPVDGSEPVEVAAAMEQQQQQ